MWSVARRAGALVAGAALASGCTASGHPARSAPTTGAQDRLVFSGGDADAAAHSRVASFAIRNIDAGPILVSSSRHAPLRLSCPASATLRVRVGDGSRLLTVRQASGQLLLRAAIRDGGHFYVLARTFGGLISREQPASIRPASYGCRR